MADKNKTATAEANAADERIRQLEAEKAALEARLAKTSMIKMKVGEKGGLSVYGLGRFPVTLYKEQWRRLFSVRTDIEKFIHDNDYLLKSKEESGAASSPVKKASGF